ncbi:MAG TPA: DUF3299 domain-containing protein [Candidatus Hydrogenedentes bacterium]|nr:DUF3299 domain-containing protein [Candidatus Hydrogenedentota bacterium]HOL77685.1 DUF3299 domain-containing protein [Candidatus Hydrogenedentota bacterium]HPO86808.1 DUF3299 domain-containing protein [Candidatus Hydrogenedentota bacterium]
MRKRTAQDLVTLLGVVVIIAGMVAFKMFSDRNDLARRMDAWRVNLENDNAKSGVEILKWDLLRRTKGTMRSGPTFDPKLLELKDTIVNLVGFMVPLYEFRDAHEFLLLPLPIECYFCQMPPMRDVMFVQMAEGQVAKMVNEPVLINGQLVLNEGPGTKFFYVIKNARWGAADPNIQFTMKQTAPEHMAAGHTRSLEQEPMLEGSEPPGTGKETSSQSN